MAEARRKRASHAHESNNLNYGHLGTATYDEKTQTWSFLRQIESINNLGGVEDEDKEHINALPFRSVDHVVESVSIRGEAALRPVHTRKELSLRALISTPECLPASALLKRSSGLSMRQSEASTSSGLYPPGGLAFGNAAWLGQEQTRAGRSLFPAVAFISGVNGSTVRFACMQSEDIWVRDESGLQTEYKLPRISQEISTSWHASCEPVTQLCFSDPTMNGKGNTWLAARQASSTTIFRPLLHRVRVPPSGFTPDSTLQDIEPSFLESNPILSIPMSRTGGHHHADVAFNPMNPRSVALVDTHGNWSIWNIAGRRSTSARVLFTASLHISGKLLPSEKPHSSQDGLYHDGWHRSCWLSGEDGNNDLLLVCSRRDAMVYNTINGSSRAVNMRLTSGKNGVWILDIKRSKVSVGLCFVLTSTRVMVMTSVSSHWRDPAGSEPLAMICSWNHFRGQSDKTLRICVLESAKGKEQFALLNHS